MTFYPVLFLFTFGFANFCSANVFNKIDDNIAIVANGEANVQLEDDMIGLRVLKVNKCVCSLRFEDQQDVMMTLAIIVHDSDISLNEQSVKFDGADFVDVMVSSNGTLFHENQILPISLHPLKVDSEKRVHLTVDNLVDGCYLPLVKGKVNEDEITAKTSGGLPVWAIVLIVIVVVAIIVGSILLAVFHRKLPCFKRRPETAPEGRPLLEVKVDSKLPQPTIEPKLPKPQSEGPLKEMNLSSAIPPPPDRPPPPVPPTPSLSAPQVTTETPSAVAPPTSEQPPVRVPSATPPPPTTAPPTSDEPPPRFTARGARVHRSVPQHLLDNPQPTTMTRSSERRKRKLRKNSLEEGNRPPSYQPPPPPPPPRAPTASTEQPGPSAETEEGKKRCCPEKDASIAPAPTSAFYRELPPTKRLPQTEYLNFTPSEGSPHPSQETKERVSTEEVGRKKVSGREPAKDAKPKPEPKPDAKAENKKPPSSEDKNVNHAVDDEDYRK